MGTSRLAIAAVMLLVVACASPDQQASAPEARASDERDASSPESADASPGSGDQPLPVPDGTGKEHDGAAAPTQAAHLDVEGRRLDGGRLDLGELIGSPVALWMWTPW